MFDNRSDERHATLIAGLILVILLAAVAAFSAADAPMYGFANMAQQFTKDLN